MVWSMYKFAWKSNERYEIIGQSGGIYQIIHKNRLTGQQSQATCRFMVLKDDTKFDDTDLKNCEDVTNLNATLIYHRWKFVYESLPFCQFLANQSQLHA